MSEYMAAEIHIGGKIRRSVAAALGEVIAASGAGLDWGESGFDPAGPDELIASCSADEGGPLLLRLRDDQVRWGEFDALEEFLQEHGVPYCRFSEGKYEYDAEAQAFHPDCGLCCWLTDHQREPLVRVFELTPLVDRLTKLPETIRADGGEPAAVLAELEEICNGLRDALPPAVPALETFEVIED